MSEKSAEAIRVPWGREGAKYGRLLAPYVQLDPDAWLLPGREGHFRENSYSHLLREVCFANGIKPWRPNQLRHNALTNARKTHGVDVAQILAGHSNVSTTEIYAEQDKRKAMAFVMAHG